MLEGYTVLEVSQTCGKNTLQPTIVRISILTGRVRIDCVVETRAFLRVLCFKQLDTLDADCELGCVIEGPSPVTQLFKVLPGVTDVSCGGMFPCMASCSLARTLAAGSFVRESANITAVGQ